MIRGLSYSKGRVVLFALANAMLLSATVLRFHERQSRMDWAKDIFAQEAILNSKVEALASCQTVDLEALRERVDSFRAQLGTPSAWDRLVGLLGKAWTAVPSSPEKRSGYVLLGGTFVLTSPTTSDWPQIIAAAEIIEQAPGSSIVGFEMKTSGDGERRVVDLVKFVVSIESKRNEPEPPTP